MFQIPETVVREDKRTRLLLIDGRPKYRPLIIIFKNVEDEPQSLGFQEESTNARPVSWPYLKEETRHPSNRYYDWDIDMDNSYERQPWRNVPKRPYHNNDGSKHKANKKYQYYDGIIKDRFHYLFEDQIEDEYPEYLINSEGYSVIKNYEFELESQGNEPNTMSTGDNCDEKIEDKSSSENVDQPLKPSEISTFLENSDESIMKPDGSTDWHEVSYGTDGVISSTNIETYSKEETINNRTSSDHYQPVDNVTDAMKSTSTNAVQPIPQESKEGLETPTIKAGK